MGTPKQLLAWRGSTLAELAVAALAPHVEEVVLLGDGPGLSNNQTIVSILNYVLIIGNSNGA
jgi:molybdopterin-guanine dinucleotide biosynthesis protein A